MPKAQQNKDKLYTLTEVSKKTNVSMPTLQRYKKLYQHRIPSVGKGRSQRYPEEALDVFRELKKENISKRGRPRKAASSGAKPAKQRATGSKRGRKKKASTASQAKKSEGLLTLTQISKMTKISYPTLLRYVKAHLDELPHEGTGRGRRYHPEAVAVFKRLRSQSKRGRKAGTKTASAAAGSAAKKSGRRGRPSSSGDSGLLARMKDLEKSQKRLEQMIKKQQKQLDKPFTVVLKRKSR